MTKPSLVRSGGLRAAATHKYILACLLVCGAAIGAKGLGAMAQAAVVAQTPAVASADGQRDFDFEFGAWTVQLSRRLKPLTGSNTWVEYDGTSVVRKVWDGRANLGELEVNGSSGHIRGISLRLFNPETRQWHISWANANDGLLGPAMIGGFKDGRGEFYNQESLNGRSIFVRFIFSDITAKTFKLEQAFSDDGGKTWEPNWLASFTRVQGSGD